jgi:hypothetical protein
VAEHFLVPGLPALQDKLLRVVLHQPTMALVAVEMEVLVQTLLVAAMRRGGMAAQV